MVPNLRRSYVSKTDVEWYAFYDGQWAEIDVELEAFYDDQTVKTDVEWYPILRRSSTRDCLRMRPFYIGLQRTDVECIFFCYFVYWSYFFRYSQTSNIQIPAILHMKI